MAASVAVSSAGFEPVQHLPVRLIPDQKTLEQTLSDLVGQAQVHEVLLIAGDYDSAVGPYESVSYVLRTGALERAGMRRVCVAGASRGTSSAAANLGPMSTDPVIGRDATLRLAMPHRPVGPAPPPSRPAIPA